jgi:hypothetical protein
LATATTDGDRSRAVTAAARDVDDVITAAAEGADDGVAVRGVVPADICCDSIIAIAAIEVNGLSAFSISVGVFGGIAVGVGIEGVVALLAKEFDVA